jgi:ParB family chromosome partitioning protein
METIMQSNNKVETAGEKPKIVGALGRLSARVANVPRTETQEIEIPLTKLRFDSTQPRGSLHPFDGVISENEEESIRSLSVAIRENGQIQAITVSEQDDGSYLVVVGERRSRACQLLGWATIRAVVRNDITDENKRLIIQLSENVNRKDLSDGEMAKAILRLIKGSEKALPMKQARIAEMLGQSESWLVRFVKFGDDKVQREWVLPGIINSVENVYRFSLLPMATQERLLKRIDLPESDPDHLPIPFSRAVIDANKGSNKKSEKAAEAEAVTGDRVAVFTMPPVEPSATSTAKEASAGPAESGNVLPVTSTPTLKTAGDGEEILDGGGYQLPNNDRAQILTAATKRVQDPSAHGAAVVPIRSRVHLVGLVSLMELCAGDEVLMLALQDVIIDISLGQDVAQELANKLAGHVVDVTQLPSTLQTELLKLK